MYNLNIGLHQKEEIMKNNRYEGFALPEILTALLVLGVLFVLTTPVIIRSYERNVYQAGLIDMTRDVNKALFKYSNSSGINGNGKISTAGLFSEDADIASTIAATLNFTTKVGTDCWNGQDVANNLDGSGRTDDLEDKQCFIDPQNRIWAFESLENNCTGPTADLRTDDTRKHKLQKSCGYIYLDLNGTKAPNTFGKDIYVFVITDVPMNYLYPVGGSLADIKFDNKDMRWQIEGCGNKTNEGRNCAGRIVEEGWKIKYLD